MTLYPVGRRKINRSRPRQADECACRLCLGDEPGEALVTAAQIARAAVPPPAYVLAPDPFPPAEPMTPETADKVESLLNALEAKERRRGVRA